MRKDIDHLPAEQQGELEKAKATLISEFEIATSRATQPWKRNGRILKIILFGSYARNDWVDEPENGYQSDFDILIIVSHEKLTDIAEFWYVAEDKILRDPMIGRQVNIIVHTLQEANQALSRGQYFWVDIVREGIALYELHGSSFTMPKALKPSDALEMADRYYRQQSDSIGNWLDLADFSMSKIASSVDWRRKSAFNLHQAVETCYACLLLTCTLYFPRSHNIKFLRSIAEGHEPELINAWPRATKIDRRQFELIKRAYVEARYSDNYDISIEDLESVLVKVGYLRDIVDRVCKMRLAKLQEATSH
ncbi:HEPN domain-containing protein [Novosphingobium sp.]|uniref:HEPN domain-containing protein n=1 Tax=Novosphingobium sp. TaxID=1874826 RepID=UPI003D6D5065